MDLVRRASLSVAGTLVVVHKGVLENISALNCMRLLSFCSQNPKGQSTERGCRCGSCLPHLLLYPLGLIPLAAHVWADGQVDEEPQKT